MSSTDPQPSIDPPKPIGDIAKASGLATASMSTGTPGTAGSNPTSDEVTASIAAGTSQGDLPTIPGYVIVRRIGAGGMGVVYEAINRLGRPVALKVIRPDRASEEFRVRFRKEAAALQDLDHPHIARIFEYNEVAGAPYFTMRLLTGGPLSARLAHYRDDPAKAVELLATLADAVGFLHRRDLLHRDLKPSNVLFDEKGTPYISDLGLVKTLFADDAEGMRSTSEDAPRAEQTTVDEDEGTSPGAVLGTPRYMSPEQFAAKAQEVGPWSDVWSLGTILYELLTGKRPFEAVYRSTLQSDLEKAQPVRPRELNPRLDGQLEKIVLKCLAKDPKDRYANAAALAHDLRAWLDIPRKRRAQRRFVIVGSALLVLLAAAALIAVPVRNYLADPERTLRAAQARLARGEAVEVIPAIGPAIFSRALMGAEANLYLEKDDTFTVNTQKLALIELLPDPMCDSYRFKVSVRQNVTTSRASRAGIYCMHRSRETADNVHHTFVELSVMDDDEDEKELWEKPLGRDRAVASAAGFLRLSGLNPVYHDNRPFGQEAFETPTSVGKAGPWRDLELRVGPDGVQALLGDKRIAVAKYGDLGKATKSLAKKRNIEFTAPLSARSGLGLYSMGCSASYRLGVIEPLTKDRK